MSIRQLTLPGGLTRMRINDLHDAKNSIVVTIETDSKPGVDPHSSMTCVLERGQYHMLFLHLQERLRLV